MKKVIHYIIIALLIVMFLFIAVSLFNPDILLPILDWIKSKVELFWRWNILLAFLSALAESLPIIGTIIPWQVILLSVGGFYGWLWISQFLSVFTAAILGSIISNAIWYLLWKYYGESFFSQYWVWVGIEQTELKYLKKWVNTWGPWGIILSKFHPHARAFLPFIAGSMGFLKTKFWIYNIIASTLWAAVFISIWIFFAEHYETIIKYIGYILLGIMVFIFTYMWKFKKEKLMEYWQEKNREMEKKYKK